MPIKEDFKADDGRNDGKKITVGFIVDVPVGPSAKGKYNRFLLKIFRQEWNAEAIDSMSLLLMHDTSIKVDTETFNSYVNHFQNQNKTALKNNLVPVGSNFTLVIGDRLKFSNDQKKRLEHVDFFTYRGDLALRTANQNFICYEVGLNYSPRSPDKLNVVLKYIKSSRKTKVKFLEHEVKNFYEYSYELNIHVEPDGNSNYQLAFADKRKSFEAHLQRFSSFPTLSKVEYINLQNVSFQVPGLITTFTSPQRFQVCYDGNPEAAKTIFDWSQNHQAELTRIHISHIYLKSSESNVIVVIKNVLCEENDDILIAEMVTSPEVIALGFPNNFTFEWFDATEGIYLG